VYWLHPLTLCRSLDEFDFLIGQGDNNLMPELGSQAPL
jgi:hypothetical protein